MTNKNTVLADSVAHLPHLQAFDLLVKKRFSDLELDKLLVYIIDSVDPSAIPYLAQQFDVLGYKGFRLAKTESDQREIIKKSIELHRYKGTLWAVREALTAIGFGAAVISENVTGPFTFRVSIDLGSQSLDVSQISDLAKMIEEYKNERSTLADISYSISFEDGLIIIDQSQDAEASIVEDGVTAGGDFRHNGQVLRNASRNYSHDADVLTIQII
jgi:phage tail P2-like protein